MDQSLLPIHSSDVNLKGSAFPIFIGLTVTSCTFPTKFPDYEEKWFLKLMTVISKITYRMGMVVFNSGVL